MARGLFAALFPSDCRLCGAPLLNISRLPVCLECVAAIHPISGETCCVCGDGMGGGGHEPLVCGNCQERRPHFEKACAYGSYEGELRELVHLLKYERVMPAANLLGQMLAEAISKLEIPLPVLLVPVPLYSAKRRERGFNQAELVARAALKRTFAYRPELAKDVLVRTRATVSQIGLTRPQRAENIRGAFRVGHRDKVVGSNILLVDDVLTTGTTVSECARVLRKSGAKKIWVATVARTLKHVSMNVAGDPDYEVAAAS